MDKIYEDFTTKLLPKVAEGLVITKDYFIELFGRYIKYLIITDSIQVTISALVLLSTILAIVIYLPKRLRKLDELDILWLFTIIPLTFSTVLLFEGIDNLIKSIYIPEVRIYQELQKNK